MTMHIDNWDPNTYLWILQECDVPYVPSEWVLLLEKYGKDPEKVTGSTILGRYLAKMKLKQFKDYRWSDNEFLQELSNQRIEASMKAAGNYSASEIAQRVQESQTIVFPDKPVIAETPIAVPAAQENEESLTEGLTPEDITYLKIKWGKTYRPDEWIQLEKLYNDMMESYDIQTAGHIDTLKFICKTSLKANQLLDLGDGLLLRSL